jgi:hypothetical protein
MRIESFHRVLSKISPDVVYILKKMNVRRRDRLEEIRAPFQEKMRPLREEFAPLHKQYADAWKAAKSVNKIEREQAIKEGMPEAEALEKFPYGAIDFADEKFQRWAELKDRIDKIDRMEQTPAAVAFVLVRIEGLELVNDEGEIVPSTLDNLREYGSDELYLELANEVAKELGLLEEERKNSGSPFISAAVDGEQNPSGNVASAGETAKTTAEAA